MQVTQERLDPCQVALTIEVEEDKVVHAVDRAYREYSKYITVPGFRKGKAPLNFVKQRIAESDVRQRTAEILVEPAYAEALKETAIEPYAQPQLELVQLEFAEKPFIFKAIVPLPPVVELGQYTGLSVKKPEYTVVDSDVDAEIERLRTRAAQYPEVDRPVQLGDVVVAEVSAKVEGRPELDEPRGTMIEIGGDNIAGFDDQVVGASAGETKTFTLTYPADYPEESLQGEEVEFTVLIKEVRSKELPALDDELAKTVSNGSIETLEALREDLKQGMQGQADQASQNSLEGSLVEQVVTNASVQYPSVLVESELRSDYQDLQQRLEKAGRTFPEYLASEGKTQEQLVDELKTQAERRVRIGLVLGEIAQKENLALTDDDLEAYIAEIAFGENATPAAVRAMIENRGSFDAIRNRAQTRKVLDFLKDAATIEVTAVEANAEALEASETPEAAEIETEATPAVAEETAETEETSVDASETTEKENAE